MDLINVLSQEFGIKPAQVEATVKLIDEGNTIPFIARYRKEVTGGLSDVVLRDMDDRITYLRNLENRKEEVARLIDEQGKLTPEVISAIMQEEKPNQREKVILRDERTIKLLPRDLPVSEREEYILKALEHYGRYLRKQRDLER